jgi:hypothetical protein
MIAPAPPSLDAPRTLPPGVAATTLRGQLDDAHAQLVMLAGLLPDPVKLRQIADALDNALPTDARPDMQTWLRGEASRVEREVERASELHSARAEGAGLLAMRDRAVDLRSALTNYRQTAAALREQRVGLAERHDVLDPLWNNVMTLIEETVTAIP